MKLIKKFLNLWSFNSIHLENYLSYVIHPSKYCSLIAPKSKLWWWCRMISDRLTPSQTMLGARGLDRPHSLAQESEGQTPGLFLRVRRYDRDPRKWKIFVWILWMFYLYTYIFTKNYYICKFVLKYLNGQYVQYPMVRSPRITQRVNHHQTVVSW